MLVFDRATFPLQRRWIISFTILTVISATLYFGYGEMLGGSTAFGLLCGVAATTLILHECGYALRCRGQWDDRWVARLPLPLRPPVVLVGKAWAFFRRRFDRRPTHVRLIQHLWIGIISLPVVYLHSGPRWGSAVSSGVFVLFVGVVASGVFGLLLQQVLPRLLRLEVPCETIYGRIPQLLEALEHEAELLVHATCGPPEIAGSPGGAAELVGGGPARLQAIVRDHLRGRGAGLLEHIPPGPVVGSERLLAFYVQELRPFLAVAPSVASPRAWLHRVARFRFGGNRGPLSSPARARVAFSGLRSEVDPRAVGVVDALERTCDRRRQLTHQARLHEMLHVWRAIHVSATVALLVTLLAHIYYGFKYAMIFRLLAAPP
jgi:hypothetical protein